MADRHSVQVLRKAGLPVARVAEQVGVSPRSVVRIAQEPPLACLESGATPVSRRAGRPSTVEAFRSAVAEVLAASPSLPTVEVLSQLREPRDGGDTKPDSLAHAKAKAALRLRLEPALSSSKGQAEPHCSPTGPAPKER